MRKISNISLAVLGALSLVAPSVLAATTTLRLSTYVNEVDVRYQGFKKFAEIVAAKTQGRVKVEIFPSSTLHGWSEGVDAVLGGVSDISWMPADKRLPRYRVVAALPSAVTPGDEMPSVDSGTCGRDLNADDEMAPLMTPLVRPPGIDCTRRGAWAEKLIL